MALINVLPAYRVNLVLSQYFTLAFGPNLGYAFTGRVTPWADEINPPDPSLFSTSDYVETRLNMVSLRRLYAGVNILPGIRSIKWSPGKIFSHYDHLPPEDGSDLYDKDYYVMTGQSHIFKCIWNNYGKPSTVEPYLTQNVTQILDTPDGYRWKYLHTVSEFDQYLYDTKKYIPLRSFYDPNFNGGNVIGGQIQDKGFGYLGGGDGVIPLTSSNFVGPGSGASGFAIIRKGKLVFIVITSPGAGYDSTTKIVFDADPPNNKVITVEALVQEFNQNLLAVAIYASFSTSGIEHCIVKNRGGFFDASNTSITFDGDGSGATGQVSLKQENVVGDITIISQGRNILSADVEIVSSFGINASARIKTIQDGKIAEIEMLNYGEGYNLTNDNVFVRLTNVVPIPGTIPELPILQPQVSQTLVIDKILMTTPGSGYSSVNVSLTGGRLANVRPIINPISGHGGNLPLELFSTALLLHCPFDFEGDFGGMLGDFPVGNDIRQFGIMLVPQTKNGALLVDPTATACYVFKLNNINDMSLDSIWTHPDNTRIRLRLVSTRTNVISQSVSEYYAYFNSIGFDDPVIDTNNAFFTDLIVQESNQSNAKTVTQIFDQEVDPFSGRIIYIENRPPYSRSDDQIEVIKGAISF